MLKITPSAFRFDDPTVTDSGRFLGFRKTLDNVPQNWNGYAIPLLTLTGVNRLQSLTSAEGEQPMFQIGDNQTVRFYDHLDGNSHVIEPQGIVHNGDTYTLYEIDFGLCINPVELSDEEYNDLFLAYQIMPDKVQDICSHYDALWEKMDNFALCTDMKKSLEAVGYTMSWGLSAEPFNLCKDPAHYLEWLRDFEPTRHDHEETALTALFQAIQNRDTDEVRGTDLLWDVVDALVTSDFVEAYGNSFLNKWIAEHGYGMEGEKK